MQESDLIFSKSVVTRFSHDLAGVVSAVSNSLSLLEELDGGDPETLKLATDNALILMNRLRFFRAAFGNEGPLTDMETTRKIFEGYLATLENRAVHYTCLWKTDSELPIFVFRLILLGGMVIAEILPRGGQITIHATAGSRCLCLEAEGKNILTDAQIGQVLENKSENLPSPKTVPIEFLKKYSAEQKWQISFSCQEEKAVIKLEEKK